MPCRVGEWEYANRRLSTTTEGPMRLGWDSKKTEAEANWGVPGVVHITRKGIYGLHSKVNQVKFMFGGMARFVRNTRAMAV
jgi:hypothetical protein